MWTSIRRTVCGLLLVGVVAVVAPAAVRADPQDDWQQQERERCAVEQRQRDLDEWNAQQRKSADEWQQQQAEQARRAAEERERDMDEWRQKQRQLNDEWDQQQAERARQTAAADQCQPPVAPRRGPVFVPQRFRRPVIVVALPVCQPAPAPAPAPALDLVYLSPEERAAGKFDLAMLLADGGQTANAAKFCKEIVTDYSGTPGAAQAQAYLDKVN